MSWSSRKQASNILILLNFKIASSSLPFTRSITPSICFSILENCFYIHNFLTPVSIFTCVRVLFGIGFSLIRLAPYFRTIICYSNSKCKTYTEVGHKNVIYIVKQVSMGIMTLVSIFTCVRVLFWDWIVSNSSRSVFSFAIGTLNARHTQKWDTDM